METSTLDQLIASIGSVLATTLPAAIAALVGWRYFRKRQSEHELHIAMKDILVLRRIWAEYADRHKEIDPDGKSAYYLVKDSAELDMGLQLSSEFTPGRIRARLLEAKLDRELLESIDKYFPSR